MSLPELSVQDDGINIEHSSSEKTEQQKTKYSNFLITVSTNKKPGSNEESYGLGKKLSEAMKVLCTNDNLQNIIEFNDASHEFTNEYIKSISAEYAVELGRGKQGGRIHTHCVLKVVHVSSIRLNKSEISDILLETMDDPNIQSLYVNIKIIHTTANAEEYLKKDMKDPATISNLDS
jgi:hypothetical protein